MRDFLKNFTILLIVALLGFGIYSYFNKTNTEVVDDQTNIENIVKSESNSQEDVEGTVKAKRTTDSSLNSTTDNNSNNNNNNNQNNSSNENKGN